MKQPLSFLRRLSTDSAAVSDLLHSADALLSSDGSFSLTELAQRQGLSNKSVADPVRILHTLQDHNAGRLDFSSPSKVRLLQEGSKRARKARGHYSKMVGQDRVS